jgi:hypothetical protein
MSLPHEFAVDSILACKSVKFMRVRPTHYQVDLTGTPDQVRLSGLPGSEWLA